MDNGNTNASLIELQNYNKKIVNEIHNNVVYGGVLHNGHVYDTNEYSQLKVSGAVTFALLASASNPALFPSTFAWRAADNIDVPMTITELFQFGTVVFGFVNAAHLTAVKHKDAIDAINNIDVLRSYDITTGWSR